MPKVSVITPSYNKKKYVLDAMLSVASQTFKDWDYWIIENSTDEETNDFVWDYAKYLNNPKIKIIDRSYGKSFRRMFYVPAVILNEMFDLLPGEYIFYLSDDDVIKPDCLSKMASFLDQNPDKSVVYAGLDVMQGQPDGSFLQIPGIKAEAQYQAGSNMDCVIDGGQIMFRKSCLAQITMPYFPDENNNDASHCDGLFLTNLCSKFDFYPLNENLIVKRRTELSTHINA